MRFILPNRLQYPEFVAYVDKKVAEAQQQAPQQRLPPSSSQERGQGRGQQPKGFSRYGDWSTGMWRRQEQPSLVSGQVGAYIPPHKRAANPNGQASSSSSSSTCSPPKP